jgi:hypothetical protein
MRQALVPMLHLFSPKMAGTDVNISLSLSLVMPRDVASGGGQESQETGNVAPHPCSSGRNQQSTQSRRRMSCSKPAVPSFDFARQSRSLKTSIAGRLRPVDLASNGNQRSLETGVAGLLRLVDLVFAHKLPRVACVGPDCKPHTPIT